MDTTFENGKNIPTYWKRVEFKFCFCKSILFIRFVGKTIYPSIHVSIIKNTESIVLNSIVNAFEIYVNC